MSKLFDIVLTAFPFLHSTLVHFLRGVKVQGPPEFSFPGAVWLFRAQEHLETVDTVIVTNHH